MRKQFNKEFQKKKAESGVLQVHPKKFNLKID